MTIVSVGSSFWSSCSRNIRPADRAEVKTDGRTGGDANFRQMFGARQASRIWCAAWCLWSATRRRSDPRPRIGLLPRCGASNRAGGGGGRGGMPWPGDAGAAPRQSRRMLHGLSARHLTTVLTPGGSHRRATASSRVLAPAIRHDLPGLDFFDSGKRRGGSRQPAAPWNLTPSRAHVRFVPGLTFTAIACLLGLICRGPGSGVRMTKSEIPKSKA